MAEANWYVVHTYSGYENKVKANIDKAIENRHLEDQILEVRVPMEYVKAHGIQIYNARGVYSIPMAEFAVAGVMQLYKQTAVGICLR